MSIPAPADLAAPAGAAPPVLREVPPRRRLLVSDHQGKGLVLAAALHGAGYELVGDPAAADVVLVDHDVPFHGKLPLVEACVAAGGRALLYPHGANSSLMCGWDGLYPPSPLLSGALVCAEGHAEVARRYGYPHPVYVVGWSLCELAPRRPAAPIRRVLLAPEHDAPVRERNTDVFERLLRRRGVHVTVRHVGSLEENGIPRVEGVEYVQAQVGDLAGCVAEIDAADVVVGSAGTLPALAVARGVTTVMWGTDNLWNNEQTAEAAHAALYRDYVGFPFDADRGDLWQLIEAAHADRELAADWRRRFVGGPLDVDALVHALETAPRRTPMKTITASPRELHDEALASVERGDLEAGADLLARAVSASVDLELLNDLAVVKSSLGDRDEAEALLRAALAVEPGRADAAENLAAIAAPGRAGWRDSRTLGGPDPDMPERAFPGMKAESAPLMSEHAVRYAHALGLVGGKHVLDLGCGTGYGSEMLTWAAASVRGFDLWRPAPEERPVWPGGAVLTYGHDLCRDPLPRADAATMFEVLEHLADAPAALRLVFGAVDQLVVSFPNPVFHGSHHNPYHVNDWTLEQVEAELFAAAGERFERLNVGHMTQVPAGLVVPGRDPNGYYWILVVQGAGRR